LITAACIDATGPSTRASGTWRIGWTTRPRLSRAETFSVVGTPLNVAIPRRLVAPDVVEARRLVIPGGSTPGSDSARADPAAHDESRLANAIAAVSATTVARLNAGCLVAATDIALPNMCHLFQWCLP
jgi:hypothetical protein